MNNRKSNEFSTVEKAIIVLCAIFIGIVIFLAAGILLGGMLTLLTDVWSNLI